MTTKQETVKRLEPTPETKRELFLHSGNLCAFPNCERLMMNPKGQWVGQICHIESAENGGERFNRDMSNEDRRAESNLMLMCYEHHVETNDVLAFPVSRMKEIKQQHKARFSGADFSKISSVRDVTASAIFSKVENLGALISTMRYPTDDEDEIAAMVKQLNNYIKKFIRIPLETRNFLGQFAIRMDVIAKDHGLFRDGMDEFASLRDLEQAFEKSPTAIAQAFGDLDTYNLGEVREVYVEGKNIRHGAFLRTIGEDWDFWRDAARFCRKKKVDIREITDDLNFKILDT